MMSTILTMDDYVTDWVFLQKFYSSLVGGVDKRDH